eukprot:CAMPEP_0115883582 /NCGR_PEP_ID=MMETSP0287-20121206/29641_1 /TAXON_ID=412157 /ORGANISM="Chrysochromulina rotalis, Strain UIO044" /LENGTH=84 /DNA_ID=CAMNT_0003339789 /DNA_START=177 /DNA_END=430 /DNA_ORIENTATION=+
MHGRASSPLSSSERPGQPISKASPGSAASDEGAWTECNVPPASGAGGVPRGGAISGQTLCSGGGGIGTGAGVPPAARTGVGSVE